jgi:hypothetical protein
MGRKISFTIDSFMITNQIRKYIQFNYWCLIILEELFLKLTLKRFSLYSLYSTEFVFLFLEFLFYFLSVLNLF